jgi:general secretion pathway protein G
MSAMPHAKSHGFTIVELLIVIVVIAILAAVSIVAYNGIQDRANDTAVKSDIASLVKTIKLEAVKEGHEVYPAGSRTGNATAFPGISFSPSKEAYDTSHTNLHYCEGPLLGEPSFIVVARSKSGKIFRYTPQGGLEESPLTSQALTQCRTALDDISTNYYSYGYYHVDDRWWDWTNG